MTKTLTDKQRRFAEEYPKDLNATQAAIRAGYSEKTARSIGQENLTKPDIQAAIQEQLDERSRRTEITADRVLMEYARLAFSDMREFLEWGPSGVTWKDSEKLPPEAAACVAEVSETISEGGRTRRFKLHSKTSALHDVAKHVGMFPKDGAPPVNVNVNVGSAEPNYSELSDEELRTHIAILRKLKARGIKSGGDRERALPSRN